MPANALLSREALPGIGEPDGNALAPRPTWADAYDFNAPIVADAARTAQQPQFWTDAAGQYANALMMGTTAPGMRMKPGAIDVGNVTAHINPSRMDIAKMMEAAQNHHLRVFQEGENLAVWPAYDATHAEMAAPLGFSKRAAPMDYYGRPEPPDADFSNRAGRFSFMAVGR